MTLCRRTAIAAAFLLLVPTLAPAATDLATGLEATTSATTPLPLPAVGGTDVLWDLTHGVYIDYEPTGRFSSLVGLLAGNGFTMATTAVGLDNIDLSPYEILVICLGSSWDSAYTPAEVAAIQAFIASGRGVLVMADNTDTPNDNINPITQSYGTSCGVSYLQPLDLSISNLISHPIFIGVNSLFYRAAGELDGVGPSVEAALTPDSKPAITVHKDCGLVVTGDINFADNSYITQADNETHVVNIFRWLSGGCPTANERSTWGGVKVLYR